MSKVNRDLHWLQVEIIRCEDEIKNLDWWIGEAKKGLVSAEANIEHTKLRRSQKRTSLSTLYILNLLTATQLHEKLRLKQLEEKLKIIGQ